MSEYAAGEAVVVARYGVGTITARREEPARYLVALAEGTVEVALADAPALLRPPMSRDAATALVTCVCDRPADRGDLEVLTSARAFGRLSPERQAGYLRLAYRAPRLLANGELPIIVAQADLLLGELGHALGVASEELRGSLKRGDETLRRSPTVRPPRRAVELPGFEALGTFAVTGTLVVADPSYLLGLEERADDVQRRHQAPARRGLWYGFVKAGEDGPELVLAVHEALVAKAEALRGRAELVTKLWVDGAKMAIVDGAALADALFVAEHVDTIDVEGSVGGRGVVCSSEGDGSFPLRAFSDGGEVVLVAVSFLDE